MLGTGNAASTCLRGHEPELQGNLLSAVAAAPQHADCLCFYTDALQTQHTAGAPHSRLSGTCWLEAVRLHVVGGRMSGVQACPSLFTRWPPLSS